MKKEDTKQPRASQTRSKSERPKVWVPPSSLDAPPAPKGLGTDGSELKSWDFRIRKISKDE